jgi:serine/threonine-protein kinase RsbW
VVRFAMPSRRDAVVPAVERVLRAARGAALGRGRLPDLAIAVAEALSNAAVHGNGLDPALSVDVTVTVRPGQVSVEVADRGPGFDTADVNDPTHPERLLVPGGRGVLLMRRFADSVTYNPAGNAVRLTMRRRPPSRG